MPTHRFTFLIALALAGASTAACTEAAKSPATDSPAPAQQDAGTAKDTGPVKDMATSAADVGPAPASPDAEITAPAPDAHDASSSDTAPAADGAPAGAPAAPEKFAGRWNYDDGQAQLTCPGEKPLTQNLFGTFLTFAIGAGVSPLILTSPDCNLRFDIHGQAAVIQAGQSCKNPIAGRAATSAPTAFTFTLQGQSAVQTSTWTVTFVDAPDAPCTLSAQGTLSHGQ